MLKEYEINFILLKHKLLIDRPPLFLNEFVVFILFINYKVLKKKIYISRNIFIWDDRSILEFLMVNFCLLCSIMI